MFEHLDSLTNNQAKTETRKPPYEQFMDWVTQTALNTRTDTSQYTNRFVDALPIHKLKDKTIVVIGAGGIGSPGRPKVDALRDTLLTQFMTEIYTIQTRVENYDHLMSLINHTHIDILIGAVDNMEFRNRVGKDLIGWLMEGRMESTSTNTIHYEDYGPGVYIDARMSMGLWNVYTVPFGMQARSRFLIGSTQVLNHYQEQALFPPEEGMEEPCTARALGYTGENIASYIAALVDFTLRSDLDTGNSLTDEENRTLFKNFTDTDIQKSDACPFKWHAGFDARGYNTTDVNPFLEKTKTRLFDTQEQLAMLQEKHNTLTRYMGTMVERVPAPEARVCYPIDKEQDTKPTLPVTNFYLQANDMIYKLEEGMQLDFLVDNPNTHTMELVSETVTKLENLPPGTFSIMNGPDGTRQGRITMDPGYMPGNFITTKVNRPDRRAYIRAEFIPTQDDQLGVGLNMLLHHTATLMGIKEPENTTTPATAPAPPAEKINMIVDMEVPEGSIIRMKNQPGRFEVTEVTYNRVTCHRILGVDGTDISPTRIIDFTDKETFEDTVTAILDLAREDIVA